MADNNLRQALVPVGAELIRQTRGTAPGLICPVVVDGVDKVIYAVPGVPHEMKDMLERAVLPDLRRRSGDPSVIVSRTLRTWGESESGLNERLDPVIDELEAAGTPTLAFLASGWEGIKVRLTAKAPTAAEAAALLEPVEARIRGILGDQVFGVDDDTMESVVLDLLRRRGWSAGAGRVGHRWPRRRPDHERAGCERGVRRVDRQLRQRGQVRRARRRPRARWSASRRPSRWPSVPAGSCDADVALSLTGVAGPTEQDGMPVGTLCVGIALPDGRTVTRTLRMPGLRDQMRQMSVISSLDLLRRELLALG